MDSFATVQQMADRSGGAISADHPYLRTALAAATREIRNVCGWHIAPLETLTKRGATSRAHEIWIPAQQIESIDAVTLDGTVIDVAPETTTVLHDPDTGWTNLWAYRYSVTYSAGYRVIPEDLVELTLQMAARALGATLGVEREQAGAVSVTYSAPVLLQEERARLEAYKLGRIP